MNPFAIIEDKLGYPLPESYRTFLLATDNNQYIRKLFDVVIDSSFTTNSWIDSIVTIDSFWKHNDDRDHLVDMQAHFENPASYVETEHLYVIMITVNGVVCMAMSGQHKGKIYSVDNGDFGIIYQAENLELFLQRLTGLPKYDGSL